MNNKQIFDSIKGALCSFGQARRIAASLARLPDDKQKTKIAQILEPDTLTVVTTLKDCWHCRHTAGVFTKRGLKRWCKHDSEIGVAKNQKIIKNPDVIPQNCPLRLGEEY